MGRKKVGFLTECSHFLFLFSVLYIIMASEHPFSLVEQILIVSLTIALICSIIISYQVYVLKDKHYTQIFSNWQMPMIFAILADLYFMH